MAKGEEIVKYVTQKVVTYMDMPKEERERMRQERKHRKEPWSVRWFGMIPLALSMLFRSRKKEPSESDRSR